MLKRFKAKFSRGNLVACVGHIVKRKPNLPVYVVMGAALWVWFAAVYVIYKVG
ncbi:MAG: hypothetical protein FWE57_11455 [Chitinispirillia bacterium]|nr:hypothetical protein [Chitinispirillia bacterium]